MRPNLLILISIFIINIAMFTTAHAEPIIRVGLLEVPPFVTKTPDGYKGLAIELWTKVAKEQNWQYEYVTLGGNTQKLLEAVNRGELDVLVGNVSVTHKRLQLVDFSRPYYISRVGLITSEKQRSFFELLWDIVSEIFNYKFAIALLGIIIFAHFLWWFETRKKRNKKYKTEMKDVVWNTLLVFLTQQEVGVYKSWISRLLIVALLFLSLAFSGLIIAAFTSALTLSLIPKEYTRVSDLGSKPVGVSTGSSEVELVESLGLQYKTYLDIDESVVALSRGEIEGIVEEVTSANYFLKHHHNLNLILSNLTLSYDEVGFAFQKNSPYLKPFNVQITTLQDNHQMPQICKIYLGQKEAELCGL